MPYQPPPCLARFRPSEVTPRRVLEAFTRRAQELSHAVAWSSQRGLAARNRARLSACRATHSGERCFILGNGPSLQGMDLRPLAGEVTFGLNRIYLLFDKLGFQPSYFVCINELVLEQFANEICILPMPKFLNWNRRSLFAAEDSNTMYLRLRLGLRDRFSTDVAQPIWSGGTVTFAALQIAFHMGFREAILIGVDHAYRDRGVPNTTAVRVQDQDADHFDPDYFPKGTLWQPPDLLRSEVAYELARRMYQTHSGRVVDATVGGHCPVFEKADFRSLFGPGQARGRV
jgi:hypothetical protein